MKSEALDYGRDIIAHELFARGKGIFSHGAVTIYAHSIAVAEKALSLAEKLEARGLPALDKRCLVRSALLHDFFLYEWHVPGLRYLLHGWAHPGIAAEKARQVFGISDKEYACIRTHMWPWTLFHVPRSREAWLISLADKLVALKETALCRGKRVF